DNLAGVYIADVAAWCGISFGSDEYFDSLRSPSFEANPLYYAHDLYLNGSLLSDLVIPKGVKSIAAGAFYGCNLTSIMISDSVTSIGDYAFSCDDRLYGHCAPFSNMNSLTNVTFGAAVTNIGDYAFSGRRGLSSVTISDGVLRIGQRAFYACNESLYDVTSIPGVKLVDGWAVDNSGHLLGHLDLTGVRGIADKAFDGCWAVTSVTMTEGIRRIPDYAFYGCENLTSLKIPDSVTSIGEYAFSCCSGLTSVTFGNGVTSIGKYAFDGFGDDGEGRAGGLTSVIIPSSVMEIGLEAFIGWPDLVKAVLPKALKEMVEDRYVFGGCSFDLVVEYYDVMTYNLFAGVMSDVDIGLVGYTAKGLPNGLTYAANAGKVSGIVKNAGSYAVTFSKNGEKDVAVRLVVHESCAVTFDANGGTPKTQKVEQRSEELFVLPAEPNRADHLFMGWWTEKNGGVRVTEDTVFLTGVYETLYAHWTKKRTAQSRICEDAFSGIGTVELDDNDNIVVMLSSDVNGTVEIPDNVGRVLIDLNGHSIVGADGSPAILVVPGDGAGETSQFTIFDNSDGEKGTVAGNGESVAIDIADGAALSVTLDVDDDVAVLNGDGTEQQWRELFPVKLVLKSGEYFKATLAELGYDVPT
ncbi:MAG: leucine-rich repeat protein, partial [Clostridia bacterium]|nr:leucine-rich repeat protein [Clostridia bacterium]